MAAKKKANDAKQANEMLPEGVTWEEVEKLLEGEKYKNVFKTNSLSTFKFAIEPVNRPRVIQSTLKVLQMNNPERATQEEAELEADRLIAFAHLVLQRKEKTKQSK